RSEDRRGQAREVLLDGGPAGPALRQDPGKDRQGTHHGADREDRRKHPDPPLRPLPAGRLTTAFRFDYPRRSCDRRFFLQSWLQPGKEDPPYLSRLLPMSVP